MTKSTITREQLIKKAQEQIEFCRHAKITGEGRAHVNQCAALLEIALAAMNGEPVTWGNGCDKTVPAALRYLAENERPFGGESRFNAAHLYQLAREIELMAEAPLYRHAQQPVVPATLPCSVELKPGIIIGKGCKTETLLTALRRRADYNADIDAMTPEERAEHDASIKAFKAMLEAAPQEVK